MPSDLLELLDRFRLLPELPELLFALRPEEDPLLPELEREDPEREPERPEPEREDPDLPESDLLLLCPPPFDERLLLLPEERLPLLPPFNS